MPHMDYDQALEWAAGNMRCGACGSDDIVVPCWCEPGPDGQPVFREYLDCTGIKQKHEPRSLSLCGDCGEYGTGVTDEL
jgi:hypothetical protein